MDSTGPPTAPTTLYTNIASPVAKPPSSTLSRPPHGGNGGTGDNRSKYHNKNCNSGNGGSHHGKNSTSDRGRGGSSSQTTAPTSSNGRTNASWPTYGYPWQGHMTMYLGPMPAGQQHPQAFVVTPGLYASPGPCLGCSSSSPCTSNPPQAQDGISGSVPTGTSSRWPTLPAPCCSTCLLPRSRTGWRTLARRTTPLHQLVIFLLFVLWPRPILPLSL
jgi:hypothetical protein